MVIAGMVSEAKVILTKKGDKMAFVQFEDLSGKIECLFFPKVYAECAELLASGEPLVLNGYVNMAEDPKKFFPTKISLLQNESDERVTSVRVNLPIQNLNNYSLMEIRKILLSYRGSVPIHFVFETTEGRARMPLDDNYLVSPS
jgi:DNA polymerase-3 subunit alpha